MPKPTTPHCQDPLFAPGSETDRAALNAHLAACPECASQAGRDAALTRVWEATRPADPGEAAWESVWSRVSAGLDRGARRPECLPFADPPAAVRWRRQATSVFVAAQAAALLGAVALWGAHRPAAPPADLAARFRVAVGVEIEPGEVVLIHLEGETARAVTMSREDQRPDTLDESTVLFNDAEALAGMQEMIAEMHHNVHAVPPG